MADRCPGFAQDNRSCNMAHSILKEGYGKYKIFVTENVELVGEIETGLKLMSYFVAGNKSQIAPILSELMYSLSNILVIVHDTIIIQALKSAQCYPGKYLKLTLNMIEYLEVFAEITCSKLWGNRGKWMVIIIIQSLKALLRLILLLCEKSGLQLSPPVLPMTTQQRKAAQQDLQHQKTTPDTSDNLVKKDVEEPSSAFPTFTFTLKRSGRIIRSLSSGTPAIGRTWRLPEPVRVPNSRSLYSTNRQLQSTPLNPSQKIAEILHVLRPLAHLVSLRAFGTKSWIPWLFSCGLDVTSLKLMNEKHQWNEAEKTELRFRTAAILYYILRSPFYDKFTKERAIATLMSLSKRIPGARFICSPLMDYLPVWQATYFYSWGC